MTRILERYRKCSNLVQHTSEDAQCSNLELTKLKEKVDNLQRLRRHLSGDDLDPLGIKELQQLEHQLEEGLKRVSLRKSQFLFDMIHDLRRKEELLEAANKSLQKKFSELEGQYPLDQNPRQLVGGSWHSNAGNYDTHVHSPHREPNRYGCPSAPSGNTTAGQRQSKNYDALGWMV